MDNKLLVDIVMLPTENPSILCNDYSPWQKGIIVQSIEEGTMSTKGNQHLYFTSSREIKEGDWYYNSIAKEVQRFMVSDKYWKSTSYVRLEATTESSLGLPLIPTKWIEEVYIPSQGKVKQVYILVHNSVYHEDFQPHINKFGVIILPIKDSWNRNELKIACKEAFFMFNQSNEKIFDEWFDKNY